ncbi:hypothetical protein ACFL3G_12390, partial [Planctomycetota bacterium]
MSKMSYNVLAAIVFISMFILALPVFAGVSNPEDFESYSPTINWQPTEAGEGWDLPAGPGYIPQIVAGEGPDGSQVLELDAWNSSSNGEGTWYASAPGDGIVSMTIDINMIDGGSSGGCRVMVLLRTEPYHDEVFVVFRAGSSGYHCYVYGRALGSGIGPYQEYAPGTPVRHKWYTIELQSDFTWGVYGRSRARFGPKGGTMGGWSDYIPYASNGVPRVDIIYNGVVQLDNCELTATLLPEAYSPSPPHNQTNVVRDTDLSWQPGSDALQHRVYFGTDQGSLTEVAGSPFPLATLTIPNPIGDLEGGKIYYWRVDEVNDPCLWPGNIWKFTTMPFSLTASFPSPDKNATNIS